MISKKEQIITRIPKWMNEKLKKISSKKGISKNAIISTLISKYLEQEELNLK